MSYLPQATILIANGRRPPIANSPWCLLTASSLISDFCAPVEYQTNPVTFPDTTERLSLRTGRMPNEPSPIFGHFVCLSRIEPWPEKRSLC
jgi:hypothetical protein